MDYPGNFETPAFPAGKRIAVSRFMAICALSAFLLIVFLCGILLWSSQSEKLEPFMISANNESGEWKIVGKNSGTVEYSINHTMQESVVGNFVKDWFRISADNSENENAWKSCERNICISDSLTFGDRSCAIYCNISEDLYSRFSYDIMPDYIKRSQNGETWKIDEKSLSISPAGKISDKGGTWQISTNIVSNNIGKFTVKAFLKVARNKNFYPQTMGFYVADFNAYRID
ncbi:MAG: hypothetical protein JW974_01090 [Alphaproteobacteria bacterium]|nr:hypothetical protein [Alphaproteobacteria bacterium]MBN2675382.1 hypothetical protein [Alphaproteobacteria bacterium]